MACVKEFNEIKNIILTNYRFINRFSVEEVRQNTIEDIKLLADKVGNLSEEDISNLTNLFNSLYPSDLITSMEFMSWLGKVKIEETGEPKKDSPMDSEEDYEKRELPRINFIEDVYGGSSARSSMLQLFNSLIIKSIIVDLDNEREILGNTESLNTNIQEMQNRLYRMIIEYLDDAGVEYNLPLNLYELVDESNETLGLEMLSNFFRGLTGEMRTFYNFKASIDTLSNWRRKAAVGDEKFTKKLRAYNAYFILNNFDKLLSQQFGSFINYLEVDAGKLLNKLDKYEFDYSDDANKVTTWQQKDSQERGAYDLIPKHLQRFIESLEIIDENGGHTNKFLTQNHITYFVSKIKKDFRTAKYNAKHLVQVVNANSVVDIKNKLDFSSGKGYLKGKESQISEELREQLALMLYDIEPDQLNRRVLYLEDIVDNIRDHSQLTLKALFDIRNLMDLKFTNEIEERVFKNLYRYLFADHNSLFKSSLRLYGELATLFDTTSMVDLMLYKMDVDGNISVSTLSPEMIDQNLNILKRRINSQFSTGNIDYLLKRYNVKIDEGDKKRVTFTVKDHFDLEWQFSFGAKEQQKWSMTRPYEGDRTKREEFNLATCKLTERDFAVLSGFIKDVLLIDLQSDPELKTAVLAQYKNRNGTTNLNNALYLLLDMAVNIFSNAAFFRRVDLAGVKFTPVEEIKNNVLYTTKEYKEGRLIKSAIYTTEEDAPLDFDELPNVFGTTSVRFKTKEQIAEMRAKGIEIGLEDTFSYKNIIENWLGDEDALRTNATYQSVDIISARQSEKLKAIAKAQALLDGSTFKSQVRTAERTNITIGQSSMLLAERFTRLGKYARAADHPMTVLWNNLKKAVRESNFQREASTPAGVKQNKDFNFKENFYSCFVIDFLMPLYAHRNWKVKFTEAVNSDKPNVPKIIIDSLEKILTAPLAKIQIKDVLNTVYRQCFKNILSDFADLSKFFNDNMKTAGLTDINISLENNFLEFNDWCAANGVSPVAMLAKIALEYNLKNRTNPIAIAENIHYHTNFKSGNLEINFSFLDALAKYTIMTDDEYEKKLNSLTGQIKQTDDLKEKKYLNSIKQQLIDDYQGGWKDKIKSIITSNNTKELLAKNGSYEDYYKFKSQYLDAVATFDKDLTPTWSDEFKYTAYDDFINTSNLHFLLKLLKNDVTLDLIQLESKTLITKFTDGIVDQIPELQEEFLKMMERDPDNEKTHRNALKQKFTREWFTPGWDRMAFGVLQREVSPGKWENLTSKFVEDLDIEDLSKSTEGWLNYPIQLSNYSDLSLLHMKVNGKRVEYTDPDFDISSKELYYTDDKGNEIKVKVKINPILEQYNLNSHYWTTLSSFATTGSHIWSDPKKAANTLQEECFKWFDNNKRNVINSATKLLFRLGDIWGITKMANIAVVDDIIAECTDILGDIPTVKPYDGATFVNPFMHYWENYSLNNQITGFTKKPIHEFYDERVMAGGLHKTASFAINNNTLRNSLQSHRMMWKMTGNVWTDENGKALPVDLTLGLDLAEGIEREDPDSEIIGNNCIGLTSVRYEIKGKEVRHRGPMYFANTKHGRVVKEIVEFKSLGDNKYRIATKIVDYANPEKYLKSDDGIHDEVHSDIVTINSNYTFWKALGGYDSAEYNGTLKKFEYSENSIKTVADWAAKIRFRQGKNGELILQKYDLRNVGSDTSAKAKLLSAFADQLSGKKFSNATDSYRDRDDRINYCPLKHSDIHYLVTRGATKKYAANINSKEAYMNDSPLNFFKIRMSEAGIQLDPTHEADQSVVSMMTQVISALAERGYTNDLAEEVYEALSELTSLAIADDMAAFEKYFSAGDRRQLLNVVSKLIVKEFMESKASTKDANIARAITERLIAEGRRGEVLKIKDTQGIYPFSDPSMYNLLLTTITSAMNKKAIRAKMFGTLSVLNPSHELYKIYGNRMLSEFTSFSEIEAMQNALEKTLITLQLAEIGKTYRVNGGAYNGLLFTLHNSDYYYAWKNKLRGSNYTLTEQIYSYDLAVEGNKDSISKYITDNDGQFNFYKFTTDKGEFIKRIGDVSDLQDNIIKAQKINLFGRNLAARNFFYTDTEGHVGNRYDLKPVQDSRMVQIHDVVKDKLTELYADNQLATVSDALTALKVNDRTVRDFYRDAYIKVSRNQVPRLNRNDSSKILQKYLLGIKNYGNVTIYDANNNERTVKVQSYKTKSFEAILPMVYAEQFGLRKGDTIANIIMDKTFFTERILENYVEESLPDKARYDICIKRANGKHLYIKYIGGNLEFNYDGFERLSINKYTDDDGTFRMDARRPNKKIYPLASNEDLVYYDRNSKEEVILTNDLNFYIKELKYTDINVSDKISELTKAVLSTALDNNKRNIVCSSLLKQINELGYDKLIENQRKFVENVAKFVRSTGRSNKDERDRLLGELKELSPAFMDKITSLAKKQRVSFFQSLNFTVARIPAQGMQSFMAMEIVGFNDTGVNDCYVSAEQIRLLGSDYDVDKATFMGFAYDRTGQFVKWSPFFKMYSLKELEQSMKYLPYPIGREAIKGEGSSTNTIDYSKYKDLFVVKEVSSNENYENQEESENDDVTNEAKEGQKTVYVLKKNRSQALLGQLLREINSAAKKQIEKNIYATTYTLEYDSDSVEEELVDAIIQTANKHNTYINRVEREEKENLLKNFVSYKALSIAKNPANALAGETTVDESAKPWKKLGSKSNMGARPQDSRPGDSSILWSALQLNHTGKNVIAIAASAGLKCFHAITQVFNQAIKNKSDLSDLWFNVYMEDPLSADGRTEYHFVADPFFDIEEFMDPNLTAEQYEALRQKFIAGLKEQGLTEEQADYMLQTYLNHTEWAGSNDSGILTLATDNAKELMLDRLNAGEDLSGLYLYGISIGMKAEDIFNIMTSPTAQVLARLTKDNLFTSEYLDESIANAIKFLRRVNPRTPTKSERYSSAPVNISAEKTKELDAVFTATGLAIPGLVLETDMEKLKGILDKVALLMCYKDADGNLMSIQDSVIKAAREGNMQKYIKRLHLIKNRIQYNARQAKKNDGKTHKFGYTYEEQKAKEYMDKLITYVTSINEIVEAHRKIDPEFKGNLWADLNNIATLNEGYRETAVLRSLLGLNQGAKTKTADKYKFYEDFAMLIANRLRLVDLTDTDKESIISLLSKDGRIDLEKFMEDLNYLQQLVDAYDKIKHTYNPLKIVLSVPHFANYLRAAISDYNKTRGVSLKFRTMVDTIVPYIHNEMGIRSPKEAAIFYKKGEDFINSIFANRFLIEQQPIRIPKGNKIFYRTTDAQGNEVLESNVYEYSVPIELGTIEGNETFRNWMNNEVIPKLRDTGEPWAEGVTFGRKIKVHGTEGDGVNTFLKDLTPNITNQTFDHNNIKIFALPIDMIPKSDVERDKLARYTTDFIDLLHYSYAISESERYNLLDLFFYYNLINFKNLGGASSLTALFEPLVHDENSMISKYYSFVAHMDTVYTLREGIDYTEELLKKALAPTSREMSATKANANKIEYFDNLNRDTLKFEFHHRNLQMAKEAQAEEYSIGYLGRNNYFIDPTFKGISLTPTYHKVYLLKQNVISSFDSGNVTALVSADFEGGTPKRLKVTNIKIELPENSKSNEPIQLPDVEISGETLKKMIKVRNTLGTYEFNINPVSLLIYLSSLREC